MTKYMIDPYVGNLVNPFSEKVEEAGSKKKSQTNENEGSYYWVSHWKTGDCHQLRDSLMVFPSSHWDFLENWRVECPTCYTDHSSWVGALLILEKWYKHSCPRSLTAVGMSKITEKSPFHRGSND